MLLKPHSNQTRKSEFHTFFTLSVAKIVAQKIGLVHKVLHASIHDGRRLEYDLNFEINFGKNIAKIVDGLIKFKLKKEKILSIQ